MTVIKNTGADSTQTSWESIDWNKAKSEVMKLQVRISKATTQKRWGKVKSLQWILTHSFYAKCMAVKRVTTNQGKSTPGVDGIILKDSKAKIAMVCALRRRGYKPQPLRRIYIPKSSGNKKRPLSIPTMHDRSQQALHTLALTPVAETTADYNSYGFREKRGTADAMQRIYMITVLKRSGQWILEGDIKGCFDNISHGWLLKNVAMDHLMLSKWLEAGYVEKGGLFPTSMGTPQGSIISPSLANMALDGMETALDQAFGGLQNLSQRKVTEARRLVSKNGVKFCRYADDFIITGTSKELLENEVKPVIRRFLEERGLQLSEEKTKVTHTLEGFDFLGQNVKRYVLKRGSSKLLTKPSAKNYKTFMSNVRKVIKRMATAKQEELIRRLNPMILGWANYHRHIVAKRMYAKLDHDIWLSLWRWAARRHPNKGKRWISAKYFRTLKGDSRPFNCAVRNEHGEVETFVLASASTVKIVRHTLIAMKANPFDPEWEAYFEGRATYKMQHNKDGRQKLKALWNKQNGICPYCNEPLPKSSFQGVVYYIRSRTKGGDASFRNLKMLHRECHTEIHQMKCGKVPARVRNTQA